MNIDIDDGLYERMAKVTRARGYTTTLDNEIEKALEHYLEVWEDFFFGGPLLALAETGPKGDTR